MLVFLAAVNVVVFVRVRFVSASSKRLAPALALNPHQFATALEPTPVIVAVFDVTPVKVIVFLCTALANTPLTNSTTVPFQITGIEVAELTFKVIVVLLVNAALCNEVTPEE